MQQICPQIIVKKSNIHSTGVFASKKIEKETKILQCIGDITSENCIGYIIGEEYREELTNLIRNN